MFGMIKLRTVRWLTHVEHMRLKSVRIYGLENIKIINTLEDLPIREVIILKWAVRKYVC
jgi:hypothetical protein